jgi:5-(carboxyamino)imidazole ribonucleotide mutase
MSKVAIMGISDMPVMQNIEILKGFDIEIEVDIVSAHRTPEKLFDFSKTHTRGFGNCAGAGGAAHPGMVASMSPLQWLEFL